MKTNTAWILAALGCIIGIMWLCNHDKRVRQNSPTNYVFIDSSAKMLLLRTENAKYKEKNDKLQGQNLVLTEAQTRLEAKLKEMKPIYHNLIEGIGLSKFKVDSNGVITYNGKKYLQADSNCYYTLYYADQYNQFQDSLIQIKSKELDNCFAMNDNLNNQVKFNLDLATKCSKENLDCILDRAKFRRIIWRLYRKVR